MTAPLTARVRLALLSTGLVLAAGTLLSALTYLLLRRSLENRPVMRVDITRRGPATPAPADAPNLLDRTALAAPEAPAEASSARPLPGPSPLPNPLSSPPVNSPATESVPSSASPPELPDRAALAETARRLHADALSELLTQTTIALAVVTLLTAALGWFLAGRVLRPLRTIAGTARRLSAEDLSARMPVGRPADELSVLARTINDMLDRIEHGVEERGRILESQRMFAANAAHELRTPLTTIRTAVEVTLDGTPAREELLTMAADIRDAVAQGQRTLDGLLVLARSRRGVVAPAPLDLAGVTAGCLDRAAAAAADRSLTVRSTLRAAPAAGEPVLLERAVGNLLDNAVRYNHPGGEITVTTGTTGSRVFLTVGNTGRRVAPGEARGLLAPFVRGSGSRTRSDGGSGLGLSIVRAIATAHAGELTVTARPVGGLDITLHLPSAPSLRPPLPTTVAPR
ncbi:sensor histidine kinase [Streptomyces sp. NPDC003691]